ncbi:MAG: response regulator [Chitinophagaceae bacterium]
MTRRIFLADDDRDDWFITEDAMEQVTSEKLIVFFADGELLIKALAEAWQHNNLPCLIVLDLNMPRMNGTEVLAMIKSDNRFNKIPVVIYSTSVNILEQKKCLELGARDYLTKPISSKESLAIARHFYSYCEEALVGKEY